MQKRPLTSGISDAGLDTASFPRPAEGWLLDGEIRQHSRVTRHLRRIIVDKLLWLLRDG
jgi:hypothetical protein